MDFIKMIAFALIAATGNALFAAGQKKAVMPENALTFIMMTTLVCVILTVLTAPLLGAPNYLQVFRQNGLWSLLSGVGIYVTYIGFYFLYSRYGASYYVIYAVLSIITTSVFVGVFIFKERFNLYHFGAVGAALLAVFLFWLGNKADV